MVAKRTVACQYLVFCGNPDTETWKRILLPCPSPGIPLRPLSRWETSFHSRRHCSSRYLSDRSLPRWDLLQSKMGMRCMWQRCKRVSSLCWREPFSKRTTSSNWRFQTTCYRHRCTCLQHRCKVWSKGKGYGARIHGGPNERSKDDEGIVQ